MEHYSILGLEHRRQAPSISPLEVKQAYKRALLLYHPDKQNSTSSPVAKQVVKSATVDDITLAYKTLSDSSLRAEYDRRLDSCGSWVEGRSPPTATTHTGMETVDLDELEFNEGTGIWTRKCRCGSEPAFVVTEAELEKNLDYGELAVGCNGCSLWLRVMFSAGE